MRPAPFLTALAVSAATAAAGAQPAAPRSADAPHLRVDLIASVQRPDAGDQWLGLRFALDPGWHIYWQNPGDSGSPPEVTWQLPGGVSAAPVEWPLPQRIGVGGLVNYGYAGTVVLPVRLTVAAGTTASPSTIRASLRWLVCHDICLPGNATLELAFPLAEADRRQVDAWRVAIENARALVPRPAPSLWRASASASGDFFVVDVITGQRDEHGVFFPLDASQINDSAPQAVSPAAAGLRFTLRRSDQLVHNPARLRGVVSLPGGRAYVIDAPVGR